jgi:hypothetical protein
MFFVFDVIASVGEVSAGRCKGGDIRMISSLDLTLSRSHLPTS